jgi:glycosyltransferase involved in cell wall biosynthesis
MNRIKISIIVPCYNVANYLAAFMNDISKQVYKDFEVIFVDDGSTDTTLEVLHTFNERHSFVRVIEQDNQGAGPARNIGLSKAKGEYICFFDPDDRVCSDLLQKNIEIIEEKMVDLLIFGIGYIDETGHKLGKTTTLNSKENLFIQSKSEFRKNFDPLFFQTSLFSPCNKIYRKKFLLENNLHFPSNRTGQDSLFNIDVFCNLPTIYVTSEIHYYYLFGRPGSAAKKFDKLRIMDDMEICHEFVQLAEILGLSDKYTLNLTFQKSYKLFSRIAYSSSDQVEMYKLLFSQTEVKKQLSIHKVMKIKGYKNRIRYLYLMIQKYKVFI